MLSSKIPRRVIQTLLCGICVSASHFFTTNARGFVDRRTARGCYFVFDFLSDFFLSDFFLSDFSDFLSDFF